MELFIDKNRNRSNDGRFIQGHIPHNKGKKMSDWMSSEGYDRYLKRRHVGRKSIGGCNRKKVVAITSTGKFCFFDSSVDAEKKLGKTVRSRNIRFCCQGKRKTCGGMMWYYYDDKEWFEKVKELKKLKK